VFDGRSSTCLGEGMLARTLKSGMHEVLPYALESAIEITPESKSQDLPITESIVHGGRLVLKRGNSRETKYRIRNRTGKAHTLYLDHPSPGHGYERVAPEVALESLPGYDRFAIELAPDQTTELVVRERRQVQEVVRLRNQELQRIELLIAQPYVKKDTRDFLKSVAGLMRRRARLDSDIAALSAERTQLDRGQARIRLNLTVLKDSAREQTLRQKYLDRLVRASDKIDKLDERIQELSADRKKLDAEIDARFAELSEQG
jgi:hypothetical protein